MKKNFKRCIPQLKQLAVMLALVSGSGQVLADADQICVGDSLTGLIADCVTAPTTMDTWGANLTTNGGSITGGSITGSSISGSSISGSSISGSTITSDHGSGDTTVISGDMVTITDGTVDDETRIWGGQIRSTDPSDETTVIYGDSILSTGTTGTVRILNGAITASGQISGGSLTVGTGSITGGATSVSSLNVNSGGITNAGAISGATSMTGSFIDANATTTTLSSTNTNITGVLTIGSGTITVDGDAETITGGGGGDMLTISDPDGVAIASPLSMNGNTISNLADGVAPSDAATYGQLTSAVDSLSGEIEDTRIDAFRGIAISNAMEVMRLDPGKNFGVNMGFGYYKDETALGVTGTGRISDNAQVYFGLGSDTSFKETGAKAGLSLQW